MESRLRKVKSDRVVSPETLMTGAEAWSILRISRRTLTRWCSSKPPVLSYLGLGSNTIMFRRQLIEHFIKCQEIRGAYHLPE